ncbi:hypothetical protein P280DRAFT_518272 [Massarina eburnea CBS 473.64]|uniref:Uncharacterized protein n=1 Tax=Massarina eburnea CBS 473.64 TaxID=1395130 RepID=A0A6A6S2Q7_9PLEO|nr:hypothetical protein P280DRAFT_518272 [Massarina eburnea CBS 473.64]
MNGNNSNTSTMAGGRNAAATPATTSATANLPVGGFVELEIVDTMWKAMQESKDPEDIELAAWMKTNYLNGYQGGVCLKAIGTMVGFQRLDRAYKRVRMLTGRTQEQWPFVDRRFKKLAAAAFRKNYVPEVEEDSAGSSAPSSTQPAASDIAGKS